MPRLKDLEARARGFVRELRAPRLPHQRQLAALSAELEANIAAMEALRLRTARLRDDFARLRAGPDEQPVAYSTKQSLALGRQTLLDYRVQAVLSADGVTSEPGDVAHVRGLYLDLLAASLTGSLSEDPGQQSDAGYDGNVRLVGRDWPQTAQTMIGVVRLRNLRHLLERVIAEGIPGDVIETGVWRGGSCIFMRGVLAAYAITDRTVWVADSFQGLPPPDEAAFPQDRGSTFHKYTELAISVSQVQRNFARYGLLDSQVRFLEGWFKDTLPAAPIERLAILRLDGDMYQSTMDALDALHHKVSPGGFVIIDDYALKPCRQAVHDFRDRHGIRADIEAIDGIGAFWQVPRAEGVAAAV